MIHRPFGAGRPAAAGPGTATMPKPKPMPMPMPSLLERALMAQQLRRKMAQLLPDDLFVDPAWDMMLALVVAGERGETLCVKQLILVTGEASTSALRRLERLQSRGLVFRRVDGGDQRRVLLGLTAAGRAGMVGMLDHMFAFGEDGGDAPADPRSFVPDAGA